MLRRDTSVPHAKATDANLTAGRVTAVLVVPIQGVLDGNNASDAIMNVAGNERSGVGNLVDLLRQSCCLRTKGVDGTRTEGVNMHGGVETSAT